MNAAAPTFNLTLMLPEMFLFVWACLAFTWDLVTRRKSADTVGWLAMAGPVLTGVLTLVLFYGGSYGYGKAAGNMFEVDPMALFFKMNFTG